MLVPLVDMTCVEILTLTDYTGTGSSSTGIDVSAYEGDALVLVATKKVVQGTFNLNCNHGATTAGGTAIPGLIFTEVTSAATSFQVLSVNLSEIGKYLRATWTNVGASSEYIVGVWLFAQKKYS